MRTGRAYVDDAGRLVVRQEGTAFQLEMSIARQREITAASELRAAYPNATIEREVYLRNADGTIAKDPITGQARRIDFVVIENGTVKESVEVTSLTADKRAQIIKEQTIRASGGTFIRDRSTKKLIDMSSIPTKEKRLP